MSKNVKADDSSRPIFRWPNPLFVLAVVLLVALGIFTQFRPIDGALAGVLFVALGATLLILQSLSTPARVGAGPIIEQSDKAIDRIGDQNIQSDVATEDRIRRTLSRTLTAGTKQARTFVESMPVGLIAVDANGVIRFANVRALLILQSGALEVVGKPATRFISLSEGSDPQCAPTTFDRLIEQIGEDQKEGTAHSAKASLAPVPIDIAVGALDAEDGGYLLSMTDISDRYEIEKVRQEFLSMISHDLRTPLTSVNLFFHRLSNDEEASLNPRLLKSADIARASLQRLMQLVNSLLDVDMMKNGRLQLFQEEHSCQELLQAVSASLGPIARTKEVDLVTSSTYQGSIRCDKDRILQVLDNLVSNAIKYSPQKGQIRVSAEAENATVLFEIVDQGPGIPNADAARLFERFEQMSASDQKDHKGYGLGLAICKHLVVAHGGTIGVDSAPNRGARFWFRLPRT